MIHVPLMAYPSYPAVISVMQPLVLVLPVVLVLLALLLLELPSVLALLVLPELGMVADSG